MQRQIDQTPLITDGNSPGISPYRSEMQKENKQEEEGEIEEGEIEEGEIEEGEK